MNKMNRKPISVDDAAKNNMDVFLEDGPRLSCRYMAWVILRDTKKDRVLLGGLGGCGVGQMWVPGVDSRRDYPGFDEAPDIGPEEPEVDNTETAEGSSDETR